MLYFKSCLRCKDGTVELGSDNFGSFLTCLTCGYTINSRSIRANGSIEQPTNLEEDVVMVPGAEPVAVAEDAAVSAEAEDGFEPDIERFVEELDGLAVDMEEAAV